MQLLYDRLRNETQVANPKLEALQRENSLLPNEIRQIQKEIEETNKANKELKWQTSQLKEEIAMQRQVCTYSLSFIFCLDMRKHSKHY